MYWIYCHVFPNGKRYVGLTRTSLEKRWGNGNKYTGCVLVDRAIKKYGWENVEHVIIDSAKTKEEAEGKERYYIRKYDSDNPDHGYNMLPGGDVSTNDATEEMRHKLGNGWRGKNRSDDEKRKIGEGVKKTFSRPESNGHFGLKASEETKRRMSKSQKETWDDEKREKAAERMRDRMADPDYKQKVLGNLEKYRRKPGEWNMPDATKEKLSKHFKGKWLGEKSPCSKPVLQFTKDGTFVKRWANAGEAERAGVALRCNISKCCKGYANCKTAGGYVWKFENENTNIKGQTT